MSKNYFRIHLIGLRRDLEDLVTERAIGEGATGTAENLAFVQENKFLDVETVFKDELMLDIFFDSAPSSKFILWLKELQPNLVVEQNEEMTRDWLEEWKKGFESFELVSGLWVVPSWLKPPSQAENFLSIDPGLAFGTGTHETTQMAAEMIMRLNIQPGDKVLDVGAGTGILSLVAAFSGAQTVRAIEIDSMAREVARDNLLRNPSYSQHVEVVDYLLSEESDQFSIVIANIIDGILMQMRPDFLRLLSPGGKLLLSGILEERSVEFLHDFCGEVVDFELLMSMKKGLWCSYLFKKL